MKLGNPIAEGNTAKIYLHNNYIYKVFKDYIPEGESILEAEKQRFAYLCGLPVPEIIDVTKIEGKQVIIMEYIKGETLGELFFKNKANLHTFLDLSIDIQLQIHRIFPKTSNLMQHKLYRQIENAELLTERQKDFLLRKLDSIPYENRLCHGDFHLFNLIKSDRGIFIIDWVDSTAGDVRADVYRTYLLYSQFSEEVADLYLHLYCEKSDIENSDIFEWAPIIAGARLSENVSTEDSKRLLEIVNKHCPV